jgi:hypothetical protein
VQYQFCSDKTTFCKLCCQVNWNGITYYFAHMDTLQWLVAGRWFSLVSYTNKTDHHDITEILLKVALNTITLTLLYVWDPITSCSQVFVVNLYISSQSFNFIPYRSYLLDEGFINHTQWLTFGIFLKLGDNFKLVTFPLEITK